MNDIQQNSIKAWVLAARPKTLSGAVMPVLIGGALALRQTGADFNVTPFVLCVLFFGIVPVVFTYWCIVGVENLQLLCDALILGVGMGLATDCLLMVNNYRDVNQDIISGKRTFVVMFGARAGELAYLWLGILAVAAVAAVAKLWALLMLLYLLLNVLTYRDLLRLSGRELNKVLGQTARNILVYGILASVVVYMY